MKKVSRKIILFLLLASLNAQAKYSISGISSGGFMAAQMGVIYSSKISGVGIVAAGFYGCAGDHFQQKLKKAQLNGKGNSVFYATDLDLIAIGAGDYSHAFKLSADNPIYQSVAICMQNPAAADFGFATLAERQQSGLIDPLANIQKQNIFLYHGKNDSVVKVKMQEQNFNFYKSLQLPEKQITILQTDGGHNFPTDAEGFNDCNTQSIPYVSSCQLDLAGQLLKAVLADKNLVRSKAGENKIYRIRQNISNSHPNTVAEYAYLAAPDSCIKNPHQCRLHVALHGCEMSDSFDHDFDKQFQTAAKFGYLQVLHKNERLPWMTIIPVIEDRVPQMGAKIFAEKSGYSRYANEENKLMILFPQTWIGTENYPGNPKGCWDWYGFTGSAYATNQGSEPSWLNQYIQIIQKSVKDLILQ